MMDGDTFDAPASTAPALVQQRETLRKTVERLTTRMTCLEERPLAAHLAESHLDVRFSMIDARIGHIERALGLDEHPSTDEHSHVTQLLDQHLRWLEMRLMRYLEGPYLARVVGTVPES